MNNNQNNIVEIQNHELNEQLAIISQLDEEDKQTVMKIINTMLDKSKFKDFFNENIATL